MNFFVHVKDIYQLSGDSCLFTNGLQFSLENVVNLDSFGEGDDCIYLLTLKRDGVSSDFWLTKEAFMKLSKRISRGNWAVSVAPNSEMDGSPRRIINNKRHDELCGTKNGMSKLTEDRVRFIRKNMSVPTSWFMKEYGMSRSAIAKVKRGASWQHVIV